MSFLDAQELPTSTGSSANDATASIPVTLGGAKTETRLLDASIDIMADGRPKYNFRILNSASLAVAAYEVRWTLFNAKGEQVGFSSTTETAVPTAIIEPNQVYIPPASSCMIFKGFKMERATAELTYYELLDGSIYDSQITKFGSSRKSQRARWTAFYHHIDDSVANKTAFEAESVMRSEIASELSRKPRTDSALAAESLKVSLDRDGLVNTLGLLRQAIAAAQK